MRCPNCDAYFDDEDELEVCPVCGHPFKRRLIKFSWSVLKLSLMNLAVFTFVVPVLITMVLGSMHVPFLYALIICWIPALVLGIYTMQVFFQSNKKGEGSLIWNLIGAFITILIMVFCLLMILVNAFDLYGLYSNTAVIKDDFNSIDEMVIDDENQQYYFKVEDEYYCYDASTQEYSSDENYADIMKMMKESIETDDNGSYFIMK